MKEEGRNEAHEGLLEAPTFHRVDSFAGMGYSYLALDSVGSSLLASYYLNNELASSQLSLIKPY